MREKLKRKGKHTERNKTVGKRKELEQTKHKLGEKKTEVNLREYNWKM